MTKPKVNSYDMFDTLIARKCGSYLGIFEEVADSIHQPKFIEIRRKSESELYSKGEFTFEDIYDNMINHMKEFDASAWNTTLLSIYRAKVDDPKSLSKMMREIEISAERRNLIPIKENMDKLQPGDIIVSDMYLSQDFLKEFVPHYVSVIVTNNGKAEGTIWSKLLEHYDIVSHTGDNEHSDVKTPSEHGIACQLSTETKRTVVEETLAEKYSLPIIASNCRDLRLKTYKKDPIHREMENIETQVNIPLLFCIAEHIDRMAIKYEFDNILVSARDGEKLSRILDMREKYRIGSRRYDVSYFYSSRMSRRNASDSYLSYVNKMVNNRKTLIVDLDGTGWTLRHLKDKMEEYFPETNKLIHIYLFHYLDEANLPGFMERPHKVTEYPILSAFFTNKFQHNRLELANLTNHPMVEDVWYINGNYVPKFFDKGHDIDTSKYVKTIDDVFSMAYSYITYDAFNEFKSLDDSTLLGVMDFLYSQLDTYPQSIFDVLERQQREEEKAIELNLKS